MSKDPNEPAERTGTPPYTGVVCRRCLTPVAQLLSDDTAHCPRCGYEWEVPPPVRLKAA